MTATAKQIQFLNRLASERGIASPVTATLSNRDASKLIGQLLKLPKVASAVSATAALEQGMYRTADGAVYKVQASKVSGSLYAKRLTPISGHRLVEDGTVVQWTFQYVPGAIQRLTAADRLTIDAAKAFGIKYGVCIVCGRTLTDATSVAAGIGPVCAGKV